MRVSQVKKELKALGKPEKVQVYQRFFKTGPGQYGEGDRFLGVRVPETRKLVRKYQDLSYQDIQVLLDSPIHEERLLGLLLVVRRYERGGERERSSAYRFYVKNWRAINNWDLVDVTCPNVMGAYLFERNRDVLFTWSKSKHLFKRRMSILATFYFIRRNDFRDTIRISELLLSDPEDLIHKAVGWMLREVGKRNREVEERFLRKYASKMPRVMLRYAIEKFPERERKQYLRMG